MKIIEITPLENGAHRNQTGSFLEVPEGWAVIPDGMPVPETYPFVDIAVDGQLVTAMITRTVPSPVTPTPTAEEDASAMAIDHEYRLTLIEMGVTQ